MREITEKEVKLKQQLLESPAHQKVKVGLDTVGRGHVVLSVLAPHVHLWEGASLLHP